MINYISIGNRVQKLRRSQGMTQEVLAEKINVTPTHVSRIETGTSSPSLQTLVDICNVLGITIDELMQDSIAARPGVDRRLEAVLSDCSGAELDFLANVIPALLRELRNITSGPKGRK